MSVFRHFTQKILLNPLKVDFKLNNAINVCSASIRQLNYSAVNFEQNPDPRPLFFNKEIQSLLRALMRVDISKVFKKRKLGHKLEDPEYKFMTNAELEEAIQEAWKKADDLLQIPPAIPLRQPIENILSRDPAIQGLETSTLVFTDITFGIKDCERLIVKREPDGTLREADWDTKDRMNQIYFPKEGRQHKIPRMFEGTYFEKLLEKKEYIFILDRACIQFEPDDPMYQRITSIAYQHINDNAGFELLRSTRHFGALVFFLVWNKNIDNLILDLLETAYIEEANKLLELYSKIHKVHFESEGQVKAIEDYIKKYSSKKGSLELGLQAYKDFAKQKEDLEKGIKTAHGLN